MPPLLPSFDTQYAYLFEPLTPTVPDPTPTNTLKGDTDHLDLEFMATHAGAALPVVTTADSSGSRSLALTMVHFGNGGGVDGSADGGDSGGDSSGIDGWRHECSNMLPTNFPAMHTFGKRGGLAVAMYMPRNAGGASRTCLESQCKQGRMEDGTPCYRVAGLLPPGCDVYEPQCSLDGMLEVLQERGVSLVLLLTRDHDQLPNALLPPFDSAMGADTDASATASATATLVPVSSVFRRSSAHLSEGGYTIDTALGGTPGYDGTPLTMGVVMLAPLASGRLEQTLLKLPHALTNDRTVQPGFAVLSMTDDAHVSHFWDELLRCVAQRPPRNIKPHRCHHAPILT